MLCNKRDGSGWSGEAFIGLDECQRVAVHSTKRAQKLGKISPLYDSAAEFRPELRCPTSASINLRETALNLNFRFRRLWRALLRT
jgi:hypothetical protein